MTLMRSVVSAALALALVSTARAANALAAGGDADYRSIAQHYFAENFAANPTSATFAGLHRYDALLGSYTARDYAAAFARDRRYLARLGAFDAAALSPDVRLDRTMLMNSLRDDLLINEHMQQWRRKPDTYVQLASFAVYALIERDFAAPAARLQFAIAREEQIPRMLAVARANLTGADTESAALAVDDAVGTVGFLNHDVPAAFAGVGSGAQRKALRNSTRRSATAMSAFAAWLKRGYVAHPSGTYAIGAANYAARLKYEEAIDMPLSAYLRVGQSALAHTRARMIAVARKIDAARPVAAVVAKVMQDHPTAAGLIPAAQADLAKLRAFVIARHIIDLPADANINVRLTPPFMRATTVASMDAPGPLETVATQAYYNVTPVDPHDSRRNQELYLQSFNNFERPIVSAHEVYPGHYTNYIIDKHLPLSLTEKLVSATSFVEGWAHYDEQMLVDEGWGGGNPRVRLMQLKEAILRNARYVVGVELHTGGMTPAQAETFFKTQAFLDPVDARIEARRGTQDATYGYYTLGKLEILKLRADYKKMLGPKFSLTAFHAALLKRGDPPIPLLRPLLLGRHDDGKIL